MSDKYAVATAFQGKIVDCVWRTYWNSKSFIFYSMWLASKADGIQTLEELYRLYGIDEPYSERRDIIEDIAHMSDEMIVVDLDDRNIYFYCSSHYSAADYRDREVVNMSSVKMLAEVSNAYGWDDYYGEGSACCSRKRMPFDCFNHEPLINYCEEYYGWTMPVHKPIPRSESDDAAIEVNNDDEEDYSDISKEVLERYGNLGFKKEVLKEYGEKWLAADNGLLLIPNKEQSTDENEMWDDDEEYLVDVEEEQESDLEIWSFEDYLPNKPDWLICWEDIQNKTRKIAEEKKYDK